MKNILCALLCAAAIVSNGGLRVDSENTAPAVILAAVPTASQTLGPVATLAPIKKRRIRKSQRTRKPTMMPTKASPPTRRPTKRRKTTRLPSQYLTNVPSLGEVEVLSPKTLAPALIEDGSILVRTTPPTNVNETFPDARGGGTVTPISPPTTFFERLFQPKSKSGHN